MQTASIRHFAHGNYRFVIEINFIEAPKFTTICDDGYSAADIIRNISLIDPSLRLVSGETLIFFDEIRVFPRIATALKFFKQNGRFDVICRGSLLGLNYREIESVRVGYKPDYTMRSMDFEEFLLARGYDENAIGGIVEHMTQPLPFSATEYSVWSQDFRDYCVLGGMPAVVEKYIENKTFEGTPALLRQLLPDYE